MLFCSVLLAVIWVCMLMASSQMWLTASLLEWPRCVIPAWYLTAALPLLFELLWSFTFLPVCFQDNPLTGRKADVIKAAHLCAEAALRLVKPGNQVKLLSLWPVIRLTASLSNLIKHHCVSCIRTHRSQKPGTRLQSHSSALLSRVSVNIW